MSDTVALTQGLPSHIRPGLVIGGKYRLEQEIGKGSMGTVYRAVHVTLGQRVAIKLISSEHSQSAEARRRFSVEAKAAAKLRSRHVVQIYDDGETPEGNPYIVLEYLEGESLEQRLEREHDVPLADAVRIVSHVGRALARAHAQGIVHRDLKPANIFLVRTEDDEVGWLAKVLDFGIAKLDSAGEKGTTQAGTVLGTPLFMSPEQVRGASSVDHRADLYSLGMCLFHMMTGEYAFYAPHYSDILIGICTQPLPLLREKAPWVPQAVEQWFQRACAKEPLERFQSADEMTEALSAAAGTSPLSKHQSFPEGRIAPETLVGYAAPALALATGGPEGAPASMRTQVLLQPVAQGAVSPSATGTSPGHALPYQGDGRRVAPIAISIGGEPAAATGDWTPPQRSLKPLFVGAGIGLFVVLVLAVTLVGFGGSDAKQPAALPSATPRPAALSASTLPAAPLAVLPVEPEPPAAPSAANARPALTPDAMTTTRSSETGAAKAKPKRPEGRPAATEAPSRAGSDLGF